MFIRLGLFINWEIWVCSTTMTKIFMEQAVKSRALRAIEVIELWIVYA